MSEDSLFEFHDGELRFWLNPKESELCIYGTRKGLERLVLYLQRHLLKKHGMQHIHLEDFQILTKDSMICTIAMIEQ